MFSTLRTRFGIPGVISVIALVFAMFGGAYAASNSSGGGKATASAKAKKGPRGPKGATGPAGPAGPVGPAGAKGDAGAAGSNGSQGTPGAAGQSPEGTSFSGTKTVGAVTCTEGGIEYKGANTSLVCNGKKGTTGAAGQAGPEGSPWTAGGTLPSGATETGSWWMPEGPPFQHAAISFSVPLAAELSASHVVFVPKGGTPPTECENAEHAGTASAENPEAAKGFLCTFAAQGEVENNEFGTQKAGKGTFEFGASVSGAIIFAGAKVTAGPLQYFGGTWAVTAP